MRNGILLFLGILFLASCQQKSAKTVDYMVDPYNKEIVVDEVIQTNSYTYILAGEGNKQLWLAVNKMEVERGKTYYYSESMEMSEFYSKELDRSFDHILFVGNLSTQPIPASGQMPEKAMMEASKGSPAMGRVHTEPMQPVDGSISLAELFEHQNELEGTNVKVLGEVVKYSPGIMRKNWVHIQDGTSFGELYDLTVTTNEELNLGDIVLFEGVIALKKDFGSGYFYEIIMEDAQANRISLH